MFGSTKRNLKLADQENNPGPGAYTFHSKNNESVSIGKAVKIEKPVLTPGPGAYEN
jgi:hypothetical protein